MQGTSQLMCILQLLDTLYITLPVMLLQASLLGPVSDVQRSGSIRRHFTYRPAQRTSIVVRASEGEEIPPQGKRFLSTQCLFDLVMISHISHLYSFCCYSITKALNRIPPTKSLLSSPHAASPKTPPRPDVTDPVQFVEWGGTLPNPRRALIGGLTAASIALGGNLFGVTSFLLGLDGGKTAGSLRLDALVPVDGFKRCFDSQNGFGKILLPLLRFYFRVYSVSFFLPLPPGQIDILR